MSQTTSEPAAFYKDTNPRNILITTNGPIVVDFDDLTLAPFGYDIAKLVVTLTMTHGSLPPITAVLAAYNSAVAGITKITERELMDWAEVHHILTAPYIGTNGYKYLWNQHSTY